MTDETAWFPLFEFQDWAYQSFLILPQPDEGPASTEATVTAKDWATGEFFCGQAFKATDGYSLDGRVVFRPGVELPVSARGSARKGDSLLTFEATACSSEGATKGVVYELVGWVFPELPISAGAARVLCVKGTVRAVRGPDAKPDFDLAGVPIRSDPVGFFLIKRAGK